METKQEKMARLNGLTTYIYENYIIIVPTL